MAREPEPKQRDLTRVDRINLLISSDLKHQFRVACADNGVPMTDILIAAIEDYVADYKASKAKPKRGGG